ncbi:MAG: prephenate dehydrogenase/arogenate dehydrogenase family protein [Clostridia bacterium]|nr:prephenate dehydrogenase/arogenate dehydrogenase family protein [Clostridia bacterium]
MKIGIIGLGLIGGSLARSIRANTQHTVLGFDIDAATMLRAKAIDAIHDELTPEQLPLCDIVLVALYPEKCADYIIKHADDFGDSAVVIDCAGVKRYVCGRVEPVAAEKKWTFIGGHPMAGREFSGFAYTKADLFKNASMILTPSADVDIQTREIIKHFFLESGFKMVRFCTPEAHDQMIAYTSQLAHVVSGAYVKNPLSVEHKGFSAGSFLDMTRVARLNENMWTELFMENADLLLPALDDIIDRLNTYRDVLASGDAEKIRPVLREGRLCKEALDEPEN